MRSANVNSFSQKIALAAATLFVVSAPLAAQAQCGSSHDEMSNAGAAQNDIVETAIAAGDFNTLVAAVKAAGLVEALQGEGPLTVFAPTDEAFAALPEGTVENLLKPENRDQLAAILTYHVVSGAVPAKVAKGLDSATTLQGQDFEIEYRRGQLKVGGANVVAADIETSNGIIHVIDRVLLPPTSDAQASVEGELIEMAINAGAPLYNDGQREACAAIYATTAKCLLALDTLNASQERMLERALDRAERAHSSRDRAWLLRDALDGVYGSMDRMQTSMR